jgi:hypothetical protein
VHGRHGAIAAVHARAGAAGDADLGDDLRVVKVQPISIGDVAGVLHVGAKPDVLRGHDPNSKSP